MAHYAQDCWDAEILMSYGWIECVGIADRSCYDLKAHAEASKKTMTASHKFAEPRQVTILDLNPNKKALGMAFKRDAQVILKHFEELDTCDKEEIIKTIEASGTCELRVGEQLFPITADMIAPKSVTKTVQEEKFYPSVIEPSFGVGRIFTAVMEHAFRIRADDVNRHYLIFSPTIAPVKCSILPLSNDDRLIAIVN
jgi:glycyl-tRNA synthetase